MSITTLNVTHDRCMMRGDPNFEGLFQGRLGTKVQQHLELLAFWKCMNLSLAVVSLLTVLRAFGD